MLLNGMLCLADVLVFFFSFLLIIMSFFKSKDGDTKVRGRRIESGCWGMILFIFIAMFTVCNWSSTLIKFFSPDDTDILKFSWLVMIFSSTIIMVLFGRGDAYQSATYRVLFVLSIIGIEGFAGSLSATLGASIGQLKAGTFANQTLADGMGVYLTGYVVSMSIGIFFVGISILLFQTVDINGLIIISWLVAVAVGGAVGGSKYGGVWGGVAGGIIGIIAGIVSVRKFMSKDYLDFLRYEELSDTMRRW